MGSVFAYARVSTPRQGEKGVSLTEQREAITRYAERHGLTIARWFEERDSAAQTGRRVFEEMLRLLRLRVANGVVIHKIDRSMRNLEDWNDIGRLVDAGINVHFATENVDLTTSSGRLSADIHAAFATFYSRNLAEEVKKGLYGRLKQGYYPLRAPVGYLDQGSATPKIRDPKQAPLVKAAFELYATGEYSVPMLATEMFNRGLRNLSGGPITVNNLARLLKNPFYMGLMEVMGTSYQGNHEPLVSVALFKTVQAVLAGKRVNRTKRHIYTYSRLARCGTCGYSLIAEHRKGHTYYRCHNRPFKEPAVCPPTSVREERVEAAVLSALQAVELSEAELTLALAHLEQIEGKLAQQRSARAATLRLQRDQVQNRLSQLTDLLLDRKIGQPLFEEKHNELTLELASIDEQIRKLDAAASSATEEVKKTVELAKDACLLLKTATVPNKRKLLKILLSNLWVSRKNVEITLTIPFQIIAQREKSKECGHNRGACRTWEQILSQLHTYLHNHPISLTA